MGRLEAAFANTLRRLDFDKHKANRWLLLERAKREAILREVGLLGVIQWQEQPLHVGNIVRGERRYEWGQVVFHGAIAQFDRAQASSVYAAFEYLIRQCELFPSFISLADLQRCDEKGLNALPVYGSPFKLDNLELSDRRAVLKTMLQLHNVEPREGLLIDDVCEVTDAELFDRYFKDIVEQKNELEKRRKTTHDAPSGFDEIDIWHT